MSDEPVMCRCCKEREATVNISWLGFALCQHCLDRVDERIKEVNGKVEGQLSALRYVLTTIESRRCRMNTLDYLAALDDVKTSTEAAIERLESGETMESYAVTTTQSNLTETHQEPSQNAENERQG